MKRSLTIIVLVILVAIALSPLILGAPVPKPKPFRPRGPQIECRAYMMVWGQSLPGRAVFYKDGVYEQHYIVQNTDWNTMVAYTTEFRYLGEWRWDAKTRILTLIEIERDFQPLPSKAKYTFQLKADMLETCELPSATTSGVYLSLQPLKE